MKTILALASIALLSACSNSDVTTALATPTGALFCSIQTSGGGTILANVISAEASTAAPGAAPVFVLATGAAEADVDTACANAAKAANGVSGSPVSPPTNPAAVISNVAISTPTGMSTAPAS